MRYILAALCVLSTSTAWAGTLRVPQQHVTNAVATLTVPAMPSLAGVTLHHAFVTFDGSGRIFLASNAVEVRFVR